MSDGKTYIWFHNPDASGWIYPVARRVAFDMVRVLGLLLLNERYQVGVVRPEDGFEDIGVLISFPADHALKSGIENVVSPVSEHRRWIGTRINLHKRLFRERSEANFQGQH